MSKLRPECGNSKDAAMPYDTAFGAHTCVTTIEGESYAALIAQLPATLDEMRGHFQILLEAQSEPKAL